MGHHSLRPGMSWVILWMKGGTDHSNMWECWHVYFLLVGLMANLLILFLLKKFIQYIPITISFLPIFSDLPTFPHTPFHALSFFRVKTGKHTNKQTNKNLDTVVMMAQWLKTLDFLPETVLSANTHLLANFCSSHSRGLDILHFWLLYVFHKQACCA